MTDLDRVMHRYAAGDESAFDELFEALWPRIHAYLRNLCGSRELARDLAQETFLKIHRWHRAFTHERRVEPWAYAIARNCFLSHARRRSTRMLRLCDGVADYPSPCRSADDAEAVATARELEHLIEGALMRTSPANREAFVLFRFEGLSLAEVASALGTTPGAIKLRTFRTCELMRTTLERAERDLKPARRVA
jgi:RNA polymerase sigma-70 factor (ECF subfamily)